MEYINKTERTEIVICDRCKGRGYIPDRYGMTDDECEDCNGKGRLQRVTLIRDYKMSI